MGTGTRYRVYLTPKVNLETYGDEIEISDYVRVDNVGQIVRSIDSSDYDIGVFTYADITLSCHNAKGLFNDPNDSRSLFIYSRDLAKIRVVFERENASSITFRGLIADEASRVIPETDDIEFKVLGRDSALRKAQVPSGTVTDGMTFTQALNAVLNSQEVTRVLGFDAGNIMPAYDGTVGSGAEFNGRSKKDAVDELLLAANSIMLLDEDDFMVVQSRAHDSLKEPLQLYGPGDLRGRENVVSLPEYNIGLNRVFNSVKVNNTVISDVTSVNTYGLRRKEISLNWITDPVVEAAIAQALVSEFRYPKIELQVEIATSIAKDYGLLDRVSLDYPLLIQPSGSRLPISGFAISGDEDTPTPYFSGSIVIDPNVAFKIIEISEDPNSFNTVLKLRQTGTGTSDGSFT